MMWRSARPGTGPSGSPHEGRPEPLPHQNLPVSEDDDDQEWQEYLVLLRSLRWVLTGALLLQTGLDPERLRERLQQHQPYQFLLRQAHQWVPDLYPAPPRDS